VQTHLDGIKEAIGLDPEERINDTRHLWSLDSDTQIQVLDRFPLIYPFSRLAVILGGGNGFMRVGIGIGGRGNRVRL
jgi:hypothetical protein